MIHSNFNCRKQYLLREQARLNVLIETLEDRLCNSKYSLPEYSELLEQATRCLDNYRLAYIEVRKELVKHTRENR